jgi:hypothetical protein
LERIFLMMFVRLDDQMLMVFERPEDPPNDLEAIDVLGGEYQFFDDAGRFYMGKKARAQVPFLWIFSISVETYSLIPTERADIQAALALAQSAVGVEPNPFFPNIETIRRYLMDRPTVQTEGGDK